MKKHLLILSTLLLTFIFQNSFAQQDNADKSKAWVWEDENIYRKELKNDGIPAATIEKLIAKRKNPLYAWKNFVHNIHKYRKFAEEFPEKAERALDKIERGSIRVDIEDTDIKKLSLEIDRSSNRVAYALMITAFLITSAILINVEKGPAILGVPLLAFFSFLFAVALIFILFVSIVREKLIHL